MKVAAALAVLVAACTQAAGGDDAGTQSSAHAPKILSLRTNAMTATPAAPLVVSAVVTDPDGIDDLIGGNLTTPDGASAYGSFSTSAAEGAYSISLAWDQLNATSAVSTTMGGTAARTLRAEFYDVAGNTVSQNIPVTLSCGDPTVAACNGQCEDFRFSESCGACDAPCNGNCVPYDGRYVCMEY